MWTHVEIGFYEWRRACWDVRRGVRRGIDGGRTSIAEDGQVREIREVLILRQSACP